MNSFLHGFAGELVKVSFPAPKPAVPAPPPAPKPAWGAASASAPPSYKPVAPPSTAPKPVMGANRPAPRNPNQIAPGRGSFTKSIATQKLESPAAAVRPTGARWQKGYRPRPGSDPAATKKRGRKGKKKPSFVPYETTRQRLGREQKEKAYNTDLGKKRTEAKMQKKMKQYAPALRKERQIQAKTKTNKNPVTGVTTRMGVETGQVIPQDVRARRKRDIFARYNARKSGPTPHRVISTDSKNKQTTSTINY